MVLGYIWLYTFFFHRYRIEQVSDIDTHHNFMLLNSCCITNSTITISVWIFVFLSPSLSNSNHYDFDIHSLRGQQQ